MTAAAELRAQAARLDEMADQAAPGQILPEPHTLRVIAQQLRDRAAELDDAPDLPDRLAELIEQYRPLGGAS